MRACDVRLGGADNVCILCVAGCGAPISAINSEPPSAWLLVAHLLLLYCWHTLCSYAGLIGS
jgi:hypothetical protein